LVEVAKHTDLQYNGDEGTVSSHSSTKLNLLPHDIVYLSNWVPTF